MPRISAETKHAILTEYRPRSPTHCLRALAERHGIAGGERVLQRWHARWDGSARSLQPHRGGGRPHALSAADISRHIRAPILAANRAHRATNYAAVHRRLVERTGKRVSLRTVQRIGKKQLKARHRHTKKRTQDELSAAHCDQIADLRRDLQRERSGHVLFLDESALRLSEAPTHTIVLPGEQPFVVATETTAYSKRYDMIAVCAEDRVLLPKIFSPAEREGAHVRGINGAMLQQFIDDTLAQAVEGLDRYPLTLVLDRATIHRDLERLRQAFRDRGSESIQRIVLMPPNAAKRVSPLDNALVHDWKQACRERCPATTENIEQIMNDAWANLNPRPHFKHCGLKRGQNPYFDCPDPVGHHHGR